MRTLLLTTLLAACLPLAVQESASAAPAECQGRTATIVSDGGLVTGTEGDDVISTAGAVVISALGGHDVICVTLGSADVDGGTGSDTLVLLGPDTDAERWAVNLAGTVRRSTTTVVTFTGLESYTLDFGRPVEVEVQGTDGGDTIELVGGEFDAKLAGVATCLSSALRVQRHDRRRGRLRQAVGARRRPHRHRPRQAWRGGDGR